MRKKINFQKIKGAKEQQETDFYPMDSLEEKKADANPTQKNYVPASGHFHPSS